jgi:glycogen(starch) synthase
MRVLYWTEVFWPHVGGVQTASLQLIPALQKRGHEFIVVTSHSGLDLPDEAEHDGISIYRFPFQEVLANRDLGALKTTAERVVALKQAFKPDLIHLNSSDPGALFHHITRSASLAPLLATIHGLIARDLEENTLLGRMLLSSQWITTCSKAVLLDVRRRLPQVTPRSSVVYYGLELPHLQPTSLSFDKPRLLCLGRVVASKGFDLALDAFAMISDHFPGTRLVIAGDGPARPDLEQQAANLGLADAVEFTGWVAPENVPALVNTSTIVIMPSRQREAFGLVALQAAQMARPFIATQVGGIPEIVVHGQTGLLVAEEDSLALANGITSLLEHPEMAIQLGQAAQKRAQEMFGLERFADEYDTLYRELVRA